MRFTIDKIVLWSNDGTHEPRVIPFIRDKVNVITGDSERGKSALIYIVDYCLCSEKCQIPKGIRKYVSWFGVVVQLEGKQMLLARKTPGIHKSTGEMYKEEKNSISALPKRMERNIHLDEVKFRLDELAQLSDLRLGDGDSGFDSRPSFRDMVSFLFQPQNIIADQRTMFYKTETREYRETVRNIFTYILRAIDNDTLKYKEELRELKRELKVLEREQQALKSGLEKWLGDIRGVYMQAKEFGLLRNRPYPNDDWKPQAYVRILKQIPNAVDQQGVPLLALGSTSKITDRIAELRNQEIVHSQKIEKLRDKQTVLKRIATTNSHYGQSVLDQYGRISGAGWLKKKLNHDKFCPFCNSNQKVNADYVDKLIDAASELEVKASKANDTKLVFDNEISKLNKELKILEESINSVRGELKRLIREDKKYKTRSQSINTIYRFVGELESKLSAYDALLSESDLNKKLNKLSKRIAELEGLVDDSVIRQKERTAKQRIQRTIAGYANIFKAERAEDPISLDTDDLTLYFADEDGRPDALWEIGSGSNYMAYHVSTILALHEFFLRYQNHPVPTFVFFDQPSQAYFPELKLKREEQITGNDVNRVRRIFQVLAKAIERTKGNLQIVVLEHAGPSIWEGFSEVHKVARWRDDEEEKALIPDSWIN